MCTQTGIRGESLLDLAYILLRSQRPDLVEHPENLLVLNPLHYRAFDAELSTGARILSNQWLKTAPSDRLNIGDVIVDPDLNSLLQVS